MCQLKATFPSLHNNGANSRLLGLLGHTCKYFPRSYRIWLVGRSISNEKYLPPSWNTFRSR